MRSTEASVQDAAEIDSRTRVGAPCGQFQLLFVVVRALIHHVMFVPHGVAGKRRLHELPAPCTAGVSFHVPPAVRHISFTPPGASCTPGASARSTSTDSPKGCALSGAAPAGKEKSTSGSPTFQTHRPFSRSLPMTVPLGKYG
jgi:hypothetical protein